MRTGGALTPAETAGNDGVIPAAVPGRTLVLPWPDRALSSNGNKGSWRKKAKATKAARRVAWTKAVLVGLNVNHPANPVLTFRFYPPDLRHRDLHNMPAMCKAFIDGIADAMSVDDRVFRVRWPETFDAPMRPAGAVFVTIEAAP